MDRAVEGIRKGIKNLAHACLGASPTGHVHASASVDPVNCHTQAPFCLLPIFDGLTGRGVLSDERVQVQMDKLKQQVCECLTACLFSVSCCVLGQCPTLDCER